MCDYSKVGRCTVHGGCEENGLTCKYYQRVTFPRVGQCIFCNEYNCNFEADTSTINYQI